MQKSFFLALTSSAIKQPVKQKQLFLHELQPLLSSSSFFLEEILGSGCTSVYSTTTTKQIRSGRGQPEKEIQ